MDRHKYKRASVFTTIFVACVCMLTACGVIVPGTPWKDTGASGPVIAGGQRAQKMIRCAAFEQFMSSGPCEEAFIDDQNNYLMLREVRDSADAVLGELDATKRWVGKKREGLSGYDRPSRTKPPYTLPYRMHLLTISPIVVLVVPEVDGVKQKPNYCSVPDKEGCTFSPSTDAAFFYKERPKITPGSFWYSPTFEPGAHPIDVNNPKVVINLPRAALILIAQNGEWSVVR